MHEVFMLFKIIYPVTVREEGTKGRLPAQLRICKTLQFDYMQGFENR